MHVTSIMEHFPIPFHAHINSTVYIWEFNYMKTRSYMLLVDFLFLLYKEKKKFLVLE